MPSLLSMALGAAPVFGGVLFTAAAGQLKGPDLRGLIKADLDLLERMRRHRGIFQQIFAAENVKPRVFLDIREYFRFVPQRLCDVVTVAHRRFTRERYRGTREI